MDFKECSGNRDLIKLDLIYFRQYIGALILQKKSIRQSKKSVSEKMLIFLVYTDAY
jgi:hypothetical protein